MLEQAQKECNEVSGDENSDEDEEEGNNDEL